MNTRLNAFAALAVALSAGCSEAPPKSSSKPEVTAKQHSSQRSQPESKPVASTSAAETLHDPPKLLSQEQLADGWISLFDGQTLFGWKPNSKANWTVKDGEIVSTGPPGLLLTTTRFQDYELRCEVWLESGGNSGLFLRTVPNPSNPAKDCLEFNLCDSHESFPTGSLVAREKASSSTRIEGDWHAVAVRLDGDHFTAQIDDTDVLDATSVAFSQTGGAHIGLQQNGREVRFRKVVLKPLGLKAILDDAGLGDWRFAPREENAKVETDEDAVRLQGTGYLESKATYDDFVLQFEAKLNAKDVNSGLFFRAEPSTPEAPANGYELQLQNTIANGDRTKPADYGEGFGTGAIFRRQKARYVNADDNEWFFVTLVADGNRFTTWVNGLQVAEDTDDRKPDPNPRKGRRDEAGHLSFQGHDATTDASFREVRVKSLTLD